MHDRDSNRDPAIDPPQTRSSNRYAILIEHVFLSRFNPGSREVEFERVDLELTAQELGIQLPKNLGDVLYSFRYRNPLPPAIRELAPEGESWIIRPAGRGKYRFVATKLTTIVPNSLLAQTKIPDATPGVISRYALSDEQSLLAKLRYNRLVDIFSGITCYSLQNHLRTSIPNIGQVETDEIYIGLDRKGAHYVLPVQAKGGDDILSVVQIEQDVAMAASKFPSLVCRPVAAQFLDDGGIALFEFENGESGVALVRESHYKLVPTVDLSDSEVESYRRRLEQP